MKLSELIAQLESAKEYIGDVDVYIDSQDSYTELQTIETVVNPHEDFLILSDFVSKEIK